MTSRSSTTTVSEQVPPHEEAAIRQLISSEMDALCAKDLNRLVGHYADDVYFINCRTPLLCIEGADALRRMLEDCLPHIVDSLRAEIREVTLRRTGNGGIIACGLLKFAGVEIDFPERPHTVLYRKASVGWRIASEYTWLPFKPGTTRKDLPQ